MGVLLALIGAASFAVMNISIRKGVRSGDRDNGVLTTVIINVLVFSALIVAVVLTSGITAWDWLAFWIFVAAGLASTFLGRSLLFAGIRNIGAARAAAIKNATPVVTLVIALTILGERLAPLAALGIGFVLLGIFLLIRESISSSRRPERARDPDDLVETALESEAIVDGDATIMDLTERTGLAERTFAYVSGGVRRQVAIGIGVTLLAAAIFGAGHVLRKVGMDILPNALIGATIGSWSALLAHGIAAAASGRLSAFRTAITARRPYFWLAGAGGTLGQLSFFAALAVAPVSHVAVVAASETVLTVLFAGLVAQRTEQITRRLILPAGLVFGGAIIIALSR